MHSNYKIVLLCFLLAGEINAQQELMLYSTPDIWHSNTVNPAFYPKGKRFYVGLPAYSIDFSHSADFTYNDIFRQENGQTVIDLENVLGDLEEQNDIFYDQRIETVSLGMRTRNDLWGLQLGHAIVTTGWTRYPKDLAEFIWYGNAPFIGDTLEIGPQMDIIDWHEWSAGISRRFGKFNIGARFKYLTGVSALRTDDARTQMSIYTDPDFYQLTLKTDYVFYSSSIVEAIDTAGYGYDFHTNSFGGSPSAENSGMALDLGFDAQLSENLSVSASVLNLGGSINWKKETASFTSNTEYLYEGAEIPGIDIINGSDSLDFDAKLDSLNDIFQFRKDTQNIVLKSDLPLRFYGGANVRLSPQWSLGVAFMYQTLNNRSNTGLGISARWQPFDWLSFGGMYSANSHSAFNLGFQIMFNTGPFQVYVVSDNALQGFSPVNSPAGNIRMGASLLF